MYALALLDKARQKLGSDAKTATAAGVSRQTISAIRKGDKKLSPELAAIIASALGDDPDYAVKRVMLENAAPELLTRLQRAFRVAAGVAGAAVLAATVSVPSSAEAGTIKKDRELVNISQRLTVYTSSRIRERIRRALRELKDRFSWRAGCLARA